MPNTRTTDTTAGADTTVKKIASAHSPQGALGQYYLASGKRVAMRLWRDEAAGDGKPPSRREYETVGYVLAGRAELHCEGQLLTLQPGDSWLVPARAEHTYRILEPFTAIEATAPPAHAHGRDEHDQEAAAESHDRDEDEE